MGEAVKVAVAVLTYNRFALLKCTLASLRCSDYPFDLCLLDGGSSDPLQRDFVLVQGGHLAQITTIGESVNVAVEWALEGKPDLILFSADDYEYKPGWLASLVRFWEAAPLDVALVCCNLEPDYDWNAVQGVIVAGGMLALVRDSVPGSNWSFRVGMWPQIGPLEAKTGGEDLEVCRQLREQGYRLVALDLCGHIGERQSAWCNRSWENARPLDKKLWV